MMSDHKSCYTTEHCRHRRNYCILLINHHAAYSFILCIDLGLYKFLSPVMDVTFDSVTPTADDPVRVTFVANNMTDNIQVDILYYCPEHGWEVLQGEKISDNQVAAYFHAGSSVMALIYREKGATVGTSQVSPQTGARSTWPIVVSAIFFVSFGIFALYKSKKA